METMQRSVDEAIRSPEEILAAMDKPGVRDDPKLLAQLSGELSTSIGHQAAKTSKTGIQIALISLGVAFVALLVSVIQSLPKSAPVPEYDEAEYQRQIEGFNQRAKAADSQLARTRAQLDKSEAQAARFDTMLAKWEEQAARQDKIYEGFESLIAKLSQRFENQNTGED